MKNATRISRHFRDLVKHERDLHRRYLKAEAESDDSRSRRGVIYLLEDGRVERNRLGITSVERFGGRMSGHASSNPDARACYFVLLRSRSEASLIEAEAKRILTGQRLQYRGEWFMESVEYILKVILQVANQMAHDHLKIAGLCQADDVVVSHDGGDLIEFAQYNFGTSVMKVNPHAECGFEPADYEQIYAQDRRNVDPYTFADHVRAALPNWFQ